MLRKSVWTKWLVLIFITVLLASCGSGGGGGGTGGGGADAVNITLSGTALYVETPSDLVPLYGYDPYIKGSYNTTNGTTYIYMRKGFSGTLLNPAWNEVLELDINGNSLTSYTIGVGTTHLYYTKTSPSINYIATSGTITISAYDPVDGHIQGTFNVSNGATTMTGDFYVTREADTT